MPVGFLAIRSDDSDRLDQLTSCAQERHALFPVFSSDRLAVLTDRPAFLPIGRDGVLVGCLFSRAGETGPIRQLSIGASHVIAASRGAHLLKRYWGGYIAFIEQDDASSVVLRDPSGQVPCYVQQAGDVTLLASRPAFAELDGIDRPTIDWTALGFHLGRLSAPGRRTCLVGVTELLAGERLVLARAPTIEQAWSPWNFTGRSDYSDPTDLGRAIRDCCAGWASQFESICLTLSGGLDSSIIAASLADHPDLRCLNFLTQGPSGDERGYAQLVADSIGARMLVRELGLDTIDLSRSVTNFEPRPAGRLLGQTTDALAEAVLAQSSTGAQFNGEGGDNVFCRQLSPLPAIDRILLPGSRLKSWETLKHTSLITGTSLAHSARWAVGRLRHLNAPPQWTRDTSLLSEDLADAEDDEPMPDWLLPCRHVPPGKRAHVAGIYRAQTRKRMLPSGTPIISPLVSQPIVEAAIAIPTWAWCEGGRDRVPARQAFRGRLPDAILERQWKGGPDGFAFEFIRTRRDALRSALLDGVLAAQGLLDRSAVEKALSDAGIVRGEYHARILALAEAEAWAGGRQGRGRDRGEALPNGPSNPATG